MQFAILKQKKTFPLYCTPVSNSQQTFTQNLQFAKFAVQLVLSISRPRIGIQLTHLFERVFVCLWVVCNTTGGKTTDISKYTHTHTNGVVVCFSPKTNKPGNLDSFREMNAPPQLSTTDTVDTCQLICLGLSVKTDAGKSDNRTNTHLHINECSVQLAGRCGQKEITAFKSINQFWKILICGLRWV